MEFAAQPILVTKHPEASEKMLDGAGCGWSLHEASVKTLLKAVNAHRLSCVDLTLWPISLSLPSCATQMLIPKRANFSLCADGV
eukprot:s8286_g1.t1